MQGRKAQGAQESVWEAEHFELRSPGSASKTRKPSEMPSDPQIWGKERRQMGSPRFTLFLVHLFFYRLIIIQSFITRMGVLCLQLRHEGGLCWRMQRQEGIFGCQTALGSGPCPFIHGPCELGKTGTSVSPSVKTGKHWTSVLSSTAGIS